MPHKASHSLDSTTSSLTSEASVEIYAEKLKPRIDAIRNSSTTLQELVDIAATVVNEVFALDPRSTYTYKIRARATSVQLDKVMLAMLEFAEECGGESGKHYVAAAISSCLEEKEPVGALAALSITWLTHFLFIFKTSRGHANQPNKTPSEAATPTLDLTSTHLLEGIGPRKESFRDGVLRRDAYKCIVTGCQDETHPEPVAGIAIISLVAAHILRRAVGEFDKDTSSDSYHSAVTTFDILVNFTRLSVKSLEELSADLDHPSNGITLEKNAHDAFDNFKWCLQKTETENVYDVKILRPEFQRHPFDFNRITFEDHTNEFSNQTRKSKRNAPLNIPNPRYIEIHAAIAGILHMSGAGNFFDELLDNDKEDRDRVSGVRCWPDLEKLMEQRSLTDSITEALQSARVY